MTQKLYYWNLWKLFFSRLLWSHYFVKLICLDKKFSRWLMDQKAIGQLDCIIFPSLFIFFFNYLAVWNDYNWYYQCFFILLIKKLSTQNKNLTIGDLNLDQMFPENVAKVDLLIQTFNLSQRSQYLTHIHRGLADPVWLMEVFHTSNSNTVSPLPSHCSDRFLLFLQIWSLYFYKI